MRSATSRRRAATAAILLVVALAQPARGATSAALPSDFNGDGYADLAIGVVGEAIGGVSTAGSVNVLFGSPNGLRAAGDQSWSQASPGVKGTSARADRFGTALASADFDRDGYADLAIGVPKDRVGVDKVRSGAVNVLYGSRHGLTEDGDQRWTEASVGIAPDGGDGFGAALAARDFDGDGYADLAIGIPNEDVAGDKNSGLVVVLRGGATGLVAGGATLLTRSMTGASSN
ncbi:MAG TPA: VCBS repeat-containing protein, partial [Candidatus Limnocylindrales bacterium]